MGHADVSLRGDVNVEGLPVLTSLPFPMHRHPACFEMFKRMSAERFGKVAIDGLRSLWLENTEFHLRFHGFKEHCSDLELVTEQFYQCVPGTEVVSQAVPYHW